MLTLLKLLQRLFRTLHSDGSPAQIAAGVALGAALGLTPLANLHNLLIFGLLIVLNVSIAAGLFALLVFAPVGFLLDPLFDRVGRTLLLDTPALTPLLTTLYNLPGFPYTRFNNSVVLGSLIGWLVLSLPIYLLARSGVVRYRATLGPRVEASRWYRAVKASRVYNVYRWFRPE